MYAAAGGGKSFLATDIGARVAHGLAWHGKRVTKGGVLYVAAEDPEGIRNRTRAWQLHHGKTEPAPFARIDASPDLRSRNESVDDLVSQVRAFES